MEKNVEKLEGVVEAFIFKKEFLKQKFNIIVLLAKTNRRMNRPILTHITYKYKT